MKNTTYILMSLSLILFSCKKYNCECVTVYSNYPKGDSYQYSNSTLYGPKSKAYKNCEKHEDEITTCQIK